MDKIFFSIKTYENEFYYNESIPFYLGVKLLLEYGNIITSKSYSIEILKSEILKSEKDSEVVELPEHNKIKDVNCGGHINDLYSLQEMCITKNHFKDLDLNNRKFLKYIWTFLDFNNLEFPNVNINEVSSSMEIFKKVFSENTIQYNITDGFDVAFLFIDKNNEYVVHPDFERGINTIMYILNLEFL